MNKQKPLSNAETASFCSQVAMLFQAGITPTESMVILLNDAQTESSKELIRAILEVCQQGEPFYKALSSTNVFPDYVIHMVQLGEESGNLDKCIRSLASYYEKEENIAHSIKSAVSYPLIMIVMMLAVIFVLISKVMPIFNQVFIELGSEMTGFAASLLTLGNSLNRYSIVLLVVVCLIAALYIIATKTKKGRRITNQLLDIIPATRAFHESLASERFASGMALCLSSGMDTFSSLDMISTLVDNKTMQERIAACKQSLIDGSNFSEALTNSGIFNNLYSQMVAVGFRSGNIDTVLEKIASNYERETDRRIQGIISILEPTLVIILSVIVGLILMSVILPLMGIMASIG